MNHFIASYIALCLCAVPVGSALVALHKQDSGIWVELCASGRLVKLDIGGRDDEPPIPTHKTQACHAVCCQEDYDIEDSDDEGAA